VDEIVIHKGQSYLTLVYQLNAGARRLLWCGPERRVKTLLRFFREFGKELILNWFKAKKRLSSGAVKGLNLKAKLTIRKAYGFKSTKNNHEVSANSLMSYTWELA
jgi:transposase